MKNYKQALVCLIFFLLINLQPVFSTEIDYIVAFDLDETLIASDKLTGQDLEIATALEYDVQKSKKGQQYVIRPGAFEILEFAQSQGFELMVLTHNTKEYAQDILSSSGLDQYFVKLKANEDLRESYNINFNKYPTHRNRTHKNKRTLASTYTSSLYNGLVKRAWLNIQGNQNIHPYLPCYNCDKYPPIYGARVLIDNSTYNIEEPMDFVGIKVEEFTAKGLEKKDNSGDLIWVTKLKEDLVKLKELGWVEFYKQKYGLKPVDHSVEIKS